MRSSLLLLILLGCGSSESSAPAPVLIGCQAPQHRDNWRQDGAAGNFAFVLVNGQAVRGTNTWTVQLLDAAGNPVTDAIISATPMMPAHGHGTSIVPQVQASDGAYTISDLYLFMAGLWEVTITAEAHGKQDNAVYAFCVAG